MEKHLDITVTGKVQGVFYRASTKDQAVNLGLTGFVKNLPNGDVYIEAEGEEDQLHKFLEWCKAGPSRAIVDKVEAKESEWKDFESFDVKR